MSESRQLGLLEPLPPPPPSPEEYRRMRTQVARIKAYMLSHGEFRTLADIKRACGGGDTGNSSALRKLRLPANGALILDSRKTGELGLWIYRVRTA